AQVLVFPSHGYNEVAAGGSEDSLLRLTLEYLPEVLGELFKRRRREPEFIRRINEAPRQTMLNHALHHEVDVDRTGTMAYRHRLQADLVTLIIESQLRVCYFI